MKAPRSSISWTDYSGGPLNFVIGCTPASAECAHCYAQGWAKRNGRNFSHVTCYPDKLEDLRAATFSFHLGAEAPFRRGLGAQPLAFVVDLGDLFHDDVPAEFIQRAVQVLGDRDDVTWQVLTKRPHRARALQDLDLLPDPLPDNIWFGTTTGTQDSFDHRIADLLTVRARVRFLSMEPLLEQVVIPTVFLEKLNLPNAGPVEWPDNAGTVNWVIVGAESGPQRRPFDLNWARSLRDQCQAAGVAYFFKQQSGLYPGYEPVLDGREWKEFPR